MSRVIMKGLHSSEYEHSLDSVTLEALRKVPLLPKVIELSNIPQSSITRYQLLGSNLRVSERQFKTLYYILRESCEVLDVEEPLLYISSEPILNAFTSCPDNPIICIHSYLLDIMDDDEVRFVIGHELAHIKSKHIVYNMLGVLLADNIVGAVLSSMPGLGTLAPAAVTALQYAFYEWKRASEYTCDRGGLLACQNFQASCKALLKLAGASKRYVDEINIPEFIRQSQDFEDLNMSAIGGLQKILLSFGQTHPWCVLRVRELVKFYKSGEYNEVLKRTKKPTALDTLINDKPTEISERGSLDEPKTLPNTLDKEAVAQSLDKAKAVTKDAFSGLAKGLMKVRDGQSRKW